MAHSENVLTRLESLLAYLIPQLSKFPRDQKFVLGDRIETRLLDVQECCLRAYYGRDKRPHLLEANLKLEISRHMVRLAHAMRYLSNQAYAVLAENMDEVGRMIGGWLKADAGRSGARTILSAPAPVDGERQADTSADNPVRSGRERASDADRIVRAPK